jgi:hypothetical protein
VRALDHQQPIAQEMTRLVTIIGGIFCLTGLGLSVVASRHFARRWTFVRGSSVAPGVVIALREEPDGIQTQTFGYPRIRFRTTSGREVTFESGMALGGRGWRIGETVSVRYRDEHPETAECNGFLPLWGATDVSTVLAVVFLSVGSGLLLGWMGKL